MKITKRQLKKLIIESVISSPVEFDVVHEGMFAGGRKERFYVIVSYSPQMELANLGLGSVDIPGEENVIFYASTATAGGAEEGEFLPVGGMNHGGRTSNWSGIVDDWIIKMRGRKSVDPGTIAASIKSQLETMYPVSLINQKVERMIQSEYDDQGKKPGDKFYYPHISMGEGQYNMNQMMIQHHKFKALRSDIEDMFPPYYHGDIVITDADEAIEAFNMLHGRMNKNLEAHTE